MMNSPEERFNNLSPLKKALFKIEKYKSELNALQSVKNTGDIAVVGMAVDLPKTDTLEGYWELLKNGEDLIAAFPESRKEQLAPFYKNAGIRPSDKDFGEGAFLERIDHFDHEFFKFSKSIATTMNPLQRLYLQTSWRALEDAGCLHPDNDKVGVFFGASGDLAYSQYLNIVEKSDSSINPASLMGNTSSIASSRVSYFMDLKGPAITLDTACSSSLVAIHQAANALFNGDCEVAIAGGAKVYISPELEKYKVGFESPTGKTKPFAKDSDGAGIGEGVAAVVLKKLDRAIADNDRIYAVVKGSAVNQDGTSSGVVAPNPKAQTAVIKEAAQRAGVALNSLGFVETHGTGTALGDPIEFQALCEAIGETYTQKSIALGAVKSNIGHLFEAAGVAGFIKCVLALQYKEIPGSLHHEEANESIDFEKSPFFVNTEKLAWNKTTHPRRCGVSSFGISGTNAHVILEEYSSPEVTEKQGTTEAVFTLSAHSEEALRALMAASIEQLTTDDSLNLSAYCYASNTKRGMYAWRFAAVVATTEELVAALKASEGIQKASYSFKLQGEATTCSLGELAEEFRKGTVISWNDHYKDQVFEAVDLPKYPLKKTTCWPVFSTVTTDVIANEPKEEIEEVAKELTYDQVFAQLGKMIEVDTGIVFDAAMAEEDFFDLGIDSIVILQFIQTIQKQYGVKLEMGMFYEVVNNLDKLTKFTVEHGRAKVSVTKTTIADKQVNKQLKEIDYFVPFKEIQKESSKSMTPEQEAHLKSLVTAIATQTKTSKASTQAYRKELANNRNVAGFKPETKEITYQIIAKSAQGAKIVDLDDNEYVDLTMGFGVNLLGYNPSFIQEALTEELRFGYPVGPMNETAGKVAALICELTANERAAFYNSGTEAVMVALRLARAKTGRAKYVLFKESYHGTFDGILALHNPLDTENPIPLAPGITDNFISNAIVLEYGSKEALQFIEKHGTELAAVLIEPVQSRRPDIQPSEFLHEVRRLTKNSGTAMILDEVITGFRIHPGGAQAWFDVKADLCTYGKVVGGGMPIGVVAGTSEFMDTVDGGHWEFGDQSYPQKTTTFVAGTFNQHPLTMCASLAILTHLKNEGPQLQEQLNAKTQGFVDRLNRFFETKNAAIKVVRFGSLFRFVLKSGWELFYQHLLANKIYVWEGRNCFLSTAHTEADLMWLYNGIVKATDDLLAAGWGSLTNKKLTAKTTVLPFTEEQQQLYALSASSDAASSSFNENQIVHLQGTLVLETLESAFQWVVNRHEALRTVKIDEAGYHIAGEVHAEFTVEDTHKTTEQTSDEAVFTHLGKKGSAVFNLEKGPFIRLRVWRENEGSNYLLLTTHHLVGDGFSIEVIWNELAAAYSALLDGKIPGWLPAAKIRSFNSWLQRESTTNNAALEFWKTELKKGYSALQLPVKTGASISKSLKGGKYSLPIEKELLEQLQALAKAERTTLFNVVFSLYAVLLHKLSGQATFVLGIPASGQLAKGEKKLVGQCVKMLPIGIQITTEASLRTVMAELKDLITKAVNFQNCSFETLVSESSEVKLPKITTEVDMNSVKSNMDFTGTTSAFYFPPIAFAKYELSISIIEIKDTLSIDFYYQSDLFDVETIEEWAAYFKNLMEEAVTNSTQIVKEISLQNPQKSAVLSAWNNF
ncbi:putative Glutamate-1-semialdehyde 2,1-aminomutase [Tenacibaculum litopenaei]|uniref:aminotransferase class III-fold pyridoxal phosphate-dependent enzyme n=1 Tax=Tenacibaculum litopenaei TaxID=396016 RepID=UPI003896209A